jgi:signal recognition particle receptor subunit beta
MFLASVDRDNQAIVLGIVYDGPPEAGKTTSIRALARGFGREVYTPEERDGRTVYFDWLEHTGGRFDGAPIRCQIMSVPGQECWQHRRAHLLERADVVVFVGDTSARAWPATVARLHDLRRWLDARDGPPVGVVFQANRRDAPDAVSMEVLRAATGWDRVALIESVALDGTGVREAFVFAVRLALDRVREEQRTGALPSCDVDSPSAVLLEQLLALEPGTQVQAAPAGAARTEAANAPRPLGVRSMPDLLEPQPLPSHDVPSGLVWPPVAGRILLREAMRGPLSSRLSDSGDHYGELSTGHLAHSAAQAWFGDLEEGRAALIAWARRHVAAQCILSKGRCIVLSPSNDGGCRLWQLVRGEPSLRELFVDGCESLIPRHAARQLASAARFLAEARASCASNAVKLPCTLDTIGVSDGGQAIFVSAFPFEELAAELPTTERVAHELATLLQHRTPDERAELCQELRLMQHRELSPIQGSRLGDLLTQLISP